MTRRATSGLVGLSEWLQINWLLAAFAKRKSLAIEAYRTFVRDGRGQPSPWRNLKNQVYLGDAEFVEKVLQYMDGDRELSEVPASQRKPVPKSLAEYAASETDRDTAIVKAYLSGGYALREIGEYFGLHYSRVSRIVGGAKGKTCPRTC